MSTSVVYDRQRIFQEAASVPMLSKEKEFALGYAVRDHGDEDALKTLVAAHVRLALKYASRGKGLDKADAQGLAMEGLMEAGKRFDPDRGFRFATYASFWMKAKITSHLSTQNSIVKKGTSPAEKAVFFNRAFVMRSMMQSHRVEDLSAFEDEHWVEATRLINEGDTSRKGHKPRKTKFSVDEVKNAFLKLHYGDSYLDTPVNDEDGSIATFGDFQEDESPQAAEIHEEQSEGEWRRSVLVEAFQKLNAREQDIVVQRRLQEKPATLEVLSGVHNVSRERIRQIEVRGLEKLRKEMFRLAAQKFGSHSPEALQLEAAMKDGLKFRI